MKTKTDISKYIVTVQGKDFITLNGLIQEGHATGIQSMITDMVNTDLSNPVFKTTVTLKTGQVFTGWGDANKGNVASKVAGALIRMSESRSISRALRFALGIDMVALEELDADENNVINNQPKAPSIGKSSGFMSKPKPITEQLGQKAPSSEAKPISKGFITTNKGLNTLPKSTTELIKPGFGKTVPGLIKKTEPVATTEITEDVEY